MRVIWAMALCFASAAWAGVPAGSSWGVESRLQQAEREIRGASSERERLTALGSLKRDIQARIQSVGRSRDPEARRLRFSLFSLEIYLGHVPEASFSRSECPEYRDRILFSASPSSDYPEYVPGEALQALELLAAVCGDPALAEPPSRKGD